MPAPITRDGVAFAPLTKVKSDATLWTAGALDIPCGELTGDVQTAWIRGALLASFGPGREIEPDTSTFDYELEAMVDGSREVRIDVTDSKGDLCASFGRFGANPPDQEIFGRVTDALLALFETTPPADFESKFFEYSVRRYGCTKGTPWVGTKKHGAPSCQPRPDSSFDRSHARDVVVIDAPALTGAAAASPGAVTDAEVEAYYARNAAPGMPPLSAIREHVVRAVLLERARTAPASALAPIESRALARVIFDLAELALYDFIPLARAFTSPYPEDLDAARGLRKLQGLRERIRDGALASATDDPALLSELVADVDRCIGLLTEAARARVPFRISRRVL